MRLFFIFILICGLARAQDKHFELAKSHFYQFEKSKKLTDLKVSYSEIKKVNQQSEKSNSIYHLAYGIIGYNYLELIKIDTNRDELINSCFEHLKTSYELDKHQKDLSIILKLTKSLGFEMYNEGIKLFEKNQNLRAYNLYKNLMEVESLLIENKTELSYQDNSGKTITLPKEEIINNLSIFCINSGKIEEGKELAIKLLEKNPTPENYIKTIQMFGKISEETLRSKYLRIALDLFPKHEDVQVLLINELINRQENKKALDLMDTLIRQSPTTNLFLFKAQLQENLSNHHGAEDTYKAGLKLYPNSYDLNYSYAYSLFNFALNELNNQDETTKPMALMQIANAKEHFLIAKSIDPKKVDIDKVLEQINAFK